MRNILIIICLTTLFSSCRRGGNELHKIPEEDYALIPYKGDETLFFKSNRGDRDFAVLTGTRKLEDGVFWVYYDHTDRNYRDESQDKVKGQQFIFLYGEKDGNTSFSLEFEGKNAGWYGRIRCPREMYLSAPEISLTINDTILNDVLVIPGADRNYYDREDFIVRLYWSRSKGVVRYDKKGDEIWTLDF